MNKKTMLKGILFLQGVTKEKDCREVEDMFQDRLRNETSRYSIRYNKLPVVFNNLNTWPTECNLQCWNCDLPIVGRPWFDILTIEPYFDIKKVGCYVNSNVILKIDPNDVLKTNKSSDVNYNIATYGAFCSPNCVQAYIDTTSGSLSDWCNRSEMLKYEYKIFNNTVINEIRPSPSKTCMIQYGGDVTAEEYRNMVDMLDAQNSREIEESNFKIICDIYKRDQS